MDSLEKKIAFSFGTVSIAFLVMTIVTLIQVNNVMESSRRIQNILEPSLETNLRLMIAINTSHASLQSWLLFRDEKFIRQKQAIWSVIEERYSQLINYSKHWDKAEQIEKLNKVGQDLALFRQHQKAIAEADHSNSRALAIQLLMEKNSSMGDQLISTLRQISDPQYWEMKRTFNEEEKQGHILKSTAIVFLVFSIIGSASLGVLLVSGVIIPLNRTVKLADAISNGNYSLSDELFSGEKKLDVALRAMTTQLYERKQENEFQRESLEKYIRELKISNEELSQFSYRTSHDLRAPLITVRGLAEVIREDIKDGDYLEAEKNAKNIIGHVKRLETLVVDILNLAKADLEITENEEINIEEIISEIQGRLKSTYIDNDVIIQTDLDHSISFHVSKVRITQVLENLISNAIKYSDENKPFRSIKISTIQRDDKNCCVVEDNGIGIPDAFNKRVFSMFQRFHPKISYGSGLGMYIIKKHVDKMEGQISFTSSTSGTKFIIELPT